MYSVLRSLGILGCAFTKYKSSVSAIDVLYVNNSNQCSSRPLEAMLEMRSVQDMELVDL
jgi:hypothetical protein